MRRTKGEESEGGEMTTSVGAATQIRASLRLDTSPQATPIHWRDAAKQPMTGKKCP